MRKGYSLLITLLLVASSAYGQAQPRLIVNEFLADPAVDVALGDANGDGVRDSANDEFVELTNVSRDTLDLTGWRVGDDEAVNFTFPEGYRLPPRHLVVIFGGGDPSGIAGYDADPLVTRVFDADSTVGNGFANGGDFIVLLSPDGTEDMYVGYNSHATDGPPTSEVVDTVTFEFGVNVPAAANQDVSVTRSPDGNPNDAEAWVLHTDVSTNPFSPGTTVSGGTIVPKVLPPQTLVINEVLADPSTELALGDANGDGERSSSGDEFVELVNVTDAPLDLSGWTLGDDEAPVTFTFPDGYMLPASGFVTIFGGGDVSNVPGYDADPLQTRAFVVDSLHLGIGNGLANGGDFVLLLSPDGTYDTYLGYGSKAGIGGPEAGTYPEGTVFEIELDVAAPANADNAVTRYPDGNTNVNDPFVQHLSVSDQPWSPSTTIDGDQTLPAPKPPITVVINEILVDAGAAGDANADGVVDAMEDQFIELVNTSEEAPVDLSGWQVGDASGVTFTFPEGYRLAPRTFVAVFGGGDVSAAPGYDADPLQTRVFAADGSLGDGLSAAGDHAVVVSADGTYDSYVALGSAQDTAPALAGVTWEFELSTAADAGNANAITRDPDGNFLAPDPFVEHLTVSEDAFSPAQSIQGLAGLDDFVDVPHPWNDGHALHFNWWERDRVVVTEASSLMPLSLDEGTIEMWFKPDSVLTNDTHDPDWTYLFGKNLGGNHPGDLGLGWARGEGRLVFFMQDGENTTNLYSSENVDEVYHPRWHHVAITWNVQDSMRIFLDGELVAAERSEIPLLGGEQAISIGSGAVDLFNSRYEGFRGMIDEVRFSVAERYTEDFEVPGEPFSPDAYTLALWHFDEGAGEVAEDATGNGFTAYLGGVDAEGNPDPASAPSWVDLAVLVSNDDAADVPARFTLEQNYPNPFNPVTTIQYTLPRAAEVEIAVYNVLGQRVKELVSAPQAAGKYTIRFDGSQLASGVYFYRMRTEGVNLVRQMILLK